jgi:RNA polymerase sigma-70 factor (ECF subfamily)
LIDKRKELRAEKRGGDVSFIRWEDWIEESPSYLSLNSKESGALSARRLFDVRWAATVAEQALRRLAAECENRGRRRVFDTLNYYLSADRAEISYAKLSAALSVPEVAVKRLLHQMRVRYRALLRDEVLQTIGSAAELEDEIRYLCAALATEARAQ